MILLPFLFVSLVCGLKTIHQVTPTEEAHINPLHVLCLAVGFVCFVFALDRGGSAVTAVSNGDTSATTQCVIAVVLLLIAMAALLVFAWVSHRAFSPLARLTVLRSVKFRWHLLAYVLLQFVTIGYGYMIPNASQLGFGASVLAAGVVLLLWHEFSRLSGVPLAGLTLLAGTAVWALGTQQLRRSAMDVPVLAIGFWMTAITTVAVLLYVGSTDGLPANQPSPRVWAAIAYNALLIFGFCHVAWFALARALPPVAAYEN